MLSNLRISADRRYFVTADGVPFFYLADTAWELFHRLNRADAEVYLSDRAAKGFNAIQAVVLAEADGLRTPNALGELPLRDLSPARPNEAYFQHVDWMVDRAAELGLYTTMLPTWGDKWSRRSDAGPEVFTPENAVQFGEWLGRRYRTRPVIWMLGGNRCPENPRHYAIIRAMAEGLRRGDGGAHLMTFHTAGAASSAEFFHGDKWLDFNSRQNGHETDFHRYALTRFDYDRSPTKPVISGEPVYEDIPVSLQTVNPTYTNASDVRRAFYWNVFGGACGHTYGHHSVWQFHEAGRPSRYAPLMTWREALLQPGAFQMGIGRRLMEARPAAGRVPDEEFLVPSEAVPGSGQARLVATREASGAYAMVYQPESRAFDVRLDRISGDAVNVWRVDPRTGTTAGVGTFPTAGVQRFCPPMRGERLDWIYVFDDASREWPAPGQLPFSSARTLS